MRIECDCYGKMQMVNQVFASPWDAPGHRQERACRLSVERTPFLVAIVQTGYDIPEKSSPKKITLASHYRAYNAHVCVHLSYPDWAMGTQTVPYGCCYRSCSIGVQE